jgi:DNA-binding beta-propeller fold protein YncE
VWEFSPTGDELAHWGSGGSGPGQFSYPEGIAIDAAGTLFISESNNNRVQMFQRGGAFLGSFGSQGAEDGQFMNPVGVAVDSQGHIFVADFSNNRIQKFAGGPTTPTKRSSWGEVKARFK